MSDTTLGIKWPAPAWIWILNNLFFVCFAEEVLFRGLIQGELSQLMKVKFRYVPVVTGAFLFGLAHAAGGWSYVLFSGLAGLTYGYAFL